MAVWGDDRTIDYDIDHQALDEDAEYFRRVTAALTYLKDAEARLVAQRAPVEDDEPPAAVVVPKQANDARRAQDR